MRHQSLQLIKIFFLLLTSFIFNACNRDGVIESGARPTITLDNPSGIYSVMVGEQLIIAPIYDNIEGAKYCWSEDGVTIATTPSLRSVWDEAGIYYLTLTVTNSAGSATEEMRVEVSEPTLPAISLPVKDDLLLLAIGSDYTFAPEIKGKDTPDFSIAWYLDGIVVGRDNTYTFLAENTGEYSLRIEAGNIYGKISRTVEIKVLTSLPFTLQFPAVSHLIGSTTRHTFPGRPVYLTPVISNLDPSTLTWAVDGAIADYKGPTFVFTPSQPGTYTITATAEAGESASVEVVCTSASESSRFREADAGSSPEFSRLFEWMPAPGQFICDPQTGWSETDGKNETSACDFALRRLRDNNFVSLGAFGGYMVVGFDHSIPAGRNEYDFAVGGNAFSSSSGSRGSNEPGIVYVMQDVNGNGLPDDEWYELRGSNFNPTATSSQYSVTYYRPAAEAMPVIWTDNLGNSGTIDYLPAFHSQPYYYPGWLQEDYYTLTGSRITLSSFNWDNTPLDRGYADNLGSDTIDAAADSDDGTGQRTGFKISNAVFPDGSEVNLRFIDFVKIQTGVNAKAGVLGEVSTEVFSVTDLSIKEK